MAVGCYKAAYELGISIPGSAYHGTVLHGVNGRICGTYVGRANRKRQRDQRESDGAHEAVRQEPCKPDE